MADQNFPPLLDLPPAPPPAREPGRPSIRDLLDQDKRAVEDALTNPKRDMDPKRLDDLREFYQRFTPPVPGVFLSQPIQVAALPEALAQILSVAPEEQAVQAARAVNAPPESFDSFLESVPLEQARDLQRSYLDQQNLAAAIAAMQKNVDDFAAAQIEAERAAMEEQDQIAAMNDLASAFGIGMEGATPDMGRSGYMTAHAPFASVDDWAPSVYGEEESVPGTMSTPFGVAMGTLGENVDANPMSGQFGPISQHQMAAFDEDDPFGDDPFNAAEPAFSVAPEIGTVAPNAFASARAELAAQVAAEEQAANLADISALPGALENSQVNEISLVSPRTADRLAFAMQVQKTQALLDEIAREREAFAARNREAEQQIAQAEQQASLVSQLDDQALSDAYSSLNEAQMGALTPNAIQSAIAAQAAFPADPFGSLTSDDFGVSEADPNSTSVGAVGLSPTAAAASLTASTLTGDPFGSFSDAMAGFDPAATMSTADIAGDMGGESDDSDGSSASVGPSIGSTLSASIGSLTDSFAAPADTTSAATDVSGVDAAASDSEGDSDSDNSGGGDGLGGLGGIGLSGVDAAADVSAPSDTGDAGAAGAGDAGAGAGAGAGGDSGAGGSDSGAGAGGAGTGSGTGSDPSAWAIGGRVKKKSNGLSARLKSGKSKDKSRGLAAMPG